MSRIKPNFFLIPLFAIITASAVSYFVDAGRLWYNSINLPGWAPSNSIMVTVWTIIFILSSLPILIIWNKYSSEKKFGVIISLFVINALLIVGWNVLFFSHHLLILAFFQAVLLVIDLFFLVLFIRRFSPLAAYLLFPYSASVIYVTILTLNAWIMN